MTLQKCDTACTYRLIFEDAQRDEADAWLINSCTVKSPSQSQMATVIEAGKARGKPVIVAGCVPQGDKRSRDLEARLRPRSGGASPLACVPQPALHRSATVLTTDAPQHNSTYAMSAPALPSAGPCVPAVSKQAHMAAHASPQRSRALCRACPRSASRRSTASWKS